jgi:hypothetical protein
MPTSTDWLKRSHTSFHEQIRSTWNYIDPDRTAKLADFGYVTGSTVLAWIKGTFYSGFAAYEVTYKAWADKAERTPTKQAALVNAEQNAMALYRQLYKLLKGNPFVHDDDLVHMNMPRRHTGGGKRTSDPSSFVDCDVELTGPATLMLHWFDKGSSRGKAKPYGMLGIEVCSAILDAPPVDWSELTNSRFDTSAPLKFTFSGADRGKVFYFALRWVNRTGVKGDWSEIFSARIP